jgi:VanZ family protein
VAAASVRAVPGPTGEGVLIVGIIAKSAIGPIIECTTRYVMRFTFRTDTVPTPSADVGSGHGTCPARGHHPRHRLSDLLLRPHKPWQRGSNENTNSLLASSSQSPPTSPSTAKTTPRSRWLFVPVGFMAVLLMAARWWGWAVVLAAAVTIGVEFTQAVFLPGRTGSVGDVITNTCGAVLGASFARVLRWRQQRNLDA